MATKYMTSTGGEREMIMKIRRNIQITTIIGLVAMILTMAWTVCADNGAVRAVGDDYEKSILRGSGLEWSPVGTWVVTAPTPMGVIKVLHMIHAQDSSGKRYGGILQDCTTAPGC